jgi:PAS domain S-box-containing protein
MSDVEIAGAGETLARLAAALDAVDDAVLIVDATPHVRGGPLIVQANAAWLRTFGHTAGRLLGEPVARLIESIEPLLDADPGETLAELRVRTGEGVTITWPARTRAVMHPDGTHAGRVILPRASAGQRRDREDLDVLWTAFAHTHDSIIVYERPRAGTRARIVYVNEATIRHSGFSREELLAGSTGTGPRTDLAVVAALRDAMVRGQPMRVRLALYRKDGSMYWGEIDGRPVIDASGAARHWISIERDITDAFERERALAALLDASRLLFGELDSTALDGRFLVALTAVLAADTTIVTESPDPLVTRALAEPGVVSDERGELAIALRAPGRDPRVAVITFPGTAQANANARGVLALLAQIYAAAGRNAALFDEVHHQRAAVLELSRMKGDLITMLAHDLNNPLTAIRGFAEFLAEERAGDSEGTMAATAIIRAAERLSELGKETLALARLEDNALVITPTPIDYGALIAQIAPELSADVTLKIEGNVRGTADPMLMRGLFENLIGNAVKYSATGVPVAVEARDEGDTIVVTVEDRGIGIPHGEIPRVFDRFTRASNAREAEIPGTGFGLYLARLIVHRHHGEVAIESRVGEGTRVVVRLPRNAPTTVAPFVLILDPDEQAASYTEHVLRDAGYRVRVTQDLTTFWHALEQGDIAVAVLPEGLIPARDAARARGVPVVALRKPYLARDLLLELQSVRPFPRR